MRAITTPRTHLVQFGSDCYQFRWKRWIAMWMLPFMKKPSGLVDSQNWRTSLWEGSQGGKMTRLAVEVLPDLSKRFHCWLIWPFWIQVINWGILPKSHFLLPSSSPLDEDFWIWLILRQICVWWRVLLLLRFSRSSSPCTHGNAGRSSRFHRIWRNWGFFKSKRLRPSRALPWSLAFRNNSSPSNGPISRRGYWMNLRTTQQGKQRPPPITLQNQSLFWQLLIWHFSPSQWQLHCTDHGNWIQWNVAEKSSLFAAFHATPIGQLWPNLELLVHFCNWNAFNWFTFGIYWTSSSQSFSIPSWPWSISSWSKNLRHITFSF